MRPRSWRRCDDLLVGHIAPVLNPLHGRMGVAQLTHEAPVRRGAAAIEQAGGCKCYGPGADREDRRTLAVLGNNPVHRELIVARHQGGNDDIVGTVRVALVKIARC